MHTTGPSVPAAGACLPLARPVSASPAPPAAGAGSTPGGEGRGGEGRGGEGGRLHDLNLTAQC